jgi:hypothetical protein
VSRRDGIIETLKNGQYLQDAIVAGLGCTRYKIQSPPHSLKPPGFTTLACFHSTQPLLSL